MYSDSFSSIILLPHRCVTQRQDPHMGKCLDIQFYDILLTGNSCFQTLAIRAVTGARDQFTGNCPSLWPNYSMCFVSIPKSRLHGPFWQHYQTVWQRVMTTRLYLLRTKTGLVDLNFLPTCVLHSGTSTCLRVNLTYLCAI